MLGATPKIPQQATTTCVTSTATTSVQPAVTTSVTSDVPPPPTYSQVVAGTSAAVVRPTVPAPDPNVAVQPSETSNSELPPQIQAAHKQAYEMVQCMLNNIHTRLPEISNTQAKYLASLLQDLEDKHQIPHLELQNPQLENILVQELSKPTPVPLITVVKDFIRTKMSKN